MEAANNGELTNWSEKWGLRVGSSIFSGELTVALIISASITLKSIGMREENGWNEELWTAMILWVALAITGTFTYL